MRRDVNEGALILVGGRRKPRIVAAHDLEAGHLGSQTANVYKQKLTPFMLLREGTAKNYYTSSHM